MANIAQASGPSRCYDKLKKYNIIIGNRQGTTGDGAQRTLESPSLFCPLLAGFAAEVQNTAPTDHAITVARKNLGTLCNTFETEIYRTDASKTLLTDLFAGSRFKCDTDVVLYADNSYAHVYQSNSTGIEKANSLSGKSAMDIVVTCMEANRLEHVPEAIGEVKNEMGYTSEPLVEAMGYYVHSSYIVGRKMARVSPSYLILIIGRVIMVYAAATFLKNKEGYFLCDQIYSFNCEALNDERALCEMSRFLTVLHKRVHELWYWKLDVYAKYLGSVEIPISLLRDPEFLRNDPTVEKIENKLIYVNGRFVWKFVKSPSQMIYYSKDAHDRAFELGIAPACLSVQVICEDWILIRMDKVMGVNFNETTTHHREAWTEFRTKIAQFSNDFVHGDLRDVNIMYGSLPDQNRSGYFIVDFDWAGPIGKATYPFSINTAHKWPNGVAPGAVITQNHDHYWLDLLESMIN
jgi:hypothetical protein